MILSHKEIEEIAAAVTKDFNEFFFGPDTDGRRLPRGTPIDQFAREYLGLNVSFAYLSEDGSICGLTAYTDTEYIVEDRGFQRKIPLHRNEVLMDRNFIEPSQIRKLCGKRRFTLAHECAIKSCSRWRQTKSGKLVGGNTPPGQPIRSGS